MVAICHDVVCLHDPTKRHHVFGRESSVLAQHVSICRLPPLCSVALNMSDDGVQTNPRRKRRII